MAMILTPGSCYFLLGYLDDDCRVPFMQSLIHLSSAKVGQKQVLEHVFVDAIAWTRSGATSEADVDPDDLIRVQAHDLDTIKDLPGLIEELSQIK
jgi:hypothetical protein